MQHDKLQKPIDIPFSVQTIKYRAVEMATKLADQQLKTLKEVAAKKIAQARARRSTN